MMACRISSLIVLFLVVMHCRSSQLPDPSTSSSSPAHKHRHRHHRHNHHHKQEEQPTITGIDKAVGDLREVLKTEQDVEGDGVLSEQRTQKQIIEAVLPKVYTTTTESAVLVDDLSAGSRSRLVDESLGEEPQPLHRRLEVHHRHSFHDNQKPDHPEKRPGHPELSSILSSSPKASDEDRALVRDRKQTDIIDQKSGPSRSDLDREDQDSRTERNTTISPGVRKQEDEDISKKSVSQDRAHPEAAMESRDEKLVNRPRWRHIIVKDNITHNKSRRQDSRDEVSEPEIESDSASNPKPDTRPPRRSWFHNRPRWDSPRERQESGENSPSNSSRNLANQTEQANTDLPVNRGVKKDNVVKKDKVITKKEKKDKRPVSKKVIKQKWKRKQQKRPLSKGCPGCGNTEAKIAEARELHKQVLKAQLLDKLRLVPTFKKQPWPPKLPEQVFPDPAQRDHAGYDDQYYAKPTQLLVFGRDLGPRHRLKKPATGSYQFNVTDKVKGAVNSARLWVYKMKDANDVHEQTLVITELQFGKRRRLRERSLVARLDTNVEEGWVSFDVTRLVRRWMESRTPASLQMLAIRCKTCHRTSYRAIFGVKSNFRPVLVVRESKERAEHKDKRDTCDPTNGCCKFDMVVSFEELGIHEIFRPRSIKADYCFGTCERPDAFHYNHTMIMQHMRFNSHVDNSTMRERLQPCCVPVVLRESTIFHYLNDGLDTQVSLVPNLLVERCGCA